MLRKKLIALTAAAVVSAGGLSSASAQRGGFGHIGGRGPHEWHGPRRFSWRLPRTAFLPQRFRSWGHSCRSARHKGRPI
jgi:hypothetical protein